MSDHEPQSVGIVKEAGLFDGDDSTDQRMRNVAKKIEEHGEVHAVFEGAEKEVELRLGTVVVNYDSNTFEVWDGDHYQTFSAEALQRAYKPMDVLH